ncbi:MAG TPA: lysylphosphatidylglycerol synthase domain-containing protein [Longimicrobium sp.]|nr:lysylphosphatidylglycerol synthase domain-containing protein [Longimicrobium sp.]
MAPVKAARDRYARAAFAAGQGTRRAGRAYPPPYAPRAPPPAANGNCRSPLHRTPRPSLIRAYLLCTLMLAVDMSTRALRIHLFARGAGLRLRFAQVFVANAFGDAAAAVTPMRLGGEGARLLGLMRAGVPFSPLAAVLALEVVAYSAVVAACAGVVGWWFADDWWAEVGPDVLRAARRGVEWLVLLAAVFAAAVLVARRLRRRRMPPGAPHWRPTLASVRGATGWALAASVPLTVASVASRVAILPILAAASGPPVDLPVMITASFALTYGQFLLPTPAGAGAVELAFAGGVAGEEGVADPGLMLAWRVFTFVLPVVIGFGLAAAAYGPAALRSALLGRRPPG